MNDKNLLKNLLKASESHEEFYNFCCIAYYKHNESKTCLIANHPKNQEKNKNNQWGLPYDHNLITSIPHYINASPMSFNSKRYIAAQGPRTNTFAEFWDMTVEENSSLIISVSNETEDRGNFANFKFNRFWPDCGSVIHGDITVLLQEERSLCEWTDGRPEKIKIRRLTAKKGIKETSVTHLHMENWPDNGTILPDSLIKLREFADIYHTTGPIIVHCAAGVGRTGTFIAFHSLFHDYHTEKHTLIDVPRRIREMRSLRWGAMISDISQYQTLLNALEITLKK